MVRLVNLACKRLALKERLISTRIGVALFFVACLLVAGNSSAANPRVMLHTGLGDIEVELYSKAAPVTVANFLRYVEGGHYDGGSFYRSVRLNNQAQNNIKIEVIQGGRHGLADTGQSAPFDPIAHETTEQSDIRHEDGVVSMARLEPGSASSEFFICINDQPSLDYGGLRNPDGQGFAAFGRVVKGMDVVRKIHQAPTDPIDPDKLEYTSGQILLEPVPIHKITKLNE